jgi:hypothetical protein
MRLAVLNWRSTAEGSAPVRWSVGLEAEGEGVLTREQVVELADAVAATGGIATGIGTTRYGAQLIVDATSREEAIEKAAEEFWRAARKARLKPAPLVRTEAISEDEDADEDGTG